MAIGVTSPNTDQRQRCSRRGQQGWVLEPGAVVGHLEHVETTISAVCRVVPQCEQDLVGGFGLDIAEHEDPQPADVH